MKPLLITICQLWTLYHGEPGASGSTYVDVAEECRAITLEQARRAILKCAKESPLTCETTVAKDTKRITIEHKIQISGDPNQ